MAPDEDNPQPDVPVDDSSLLLIVVGAHLRAEMCDRPLAYRLVDRVRCWLAEHADDLAIDIQPIVCSDVWYVNQAELQKRPTISVGGPGVNALSAYYVQKLPTALVHDDQLMIQLDPEFVDLRVSVWGVDHENTVRVVDLFAGKYMDSYLRAVATQVEPHTD